MDELIRQLIEFVNNPLAEFVNNPIVLLVVVIIGLIGGASAAVTLRREPASTRWGAVAGVSVTLVLVAALTRLLPIQLHQPLQPPPPQSPATGPSVETILLFNEGQRLGEAKDYGAALYAFRRVEALYPSFPLIHLNQGVMLKELGELDAAMSLMQEEDKFRPHDPNVEYNIACTLAISGRTDDAIRKLDCAGNDGFRRCDILDNDSDWRGVRDRDDFGRARQSVCPVN